jgi:CubicO group peptidase (beta-lactamase class C family)
MRASLASPSAFAVLLLVAHGALSSQTQSTRSLSSRVENTTRWLQGSPEDHGIDAAALQALYSDMSQEPHHDLKGIVILRDGYLVSEHYFNGDSADTLHDIRSATKSITSLLMGIAIQKVWYTASMTRSVSTCRICLEMASSALQFAIC